MTRRASIDAAKLAAELLRQIMELEERRGKRQRVFEKRHAALMRAFNRHARLEESAVPNASEIKAALAAMDAATRVITRFETEVGRINGQQAKLLEELGRVWRIAEARERARQVATFSFWLEKMKGRSNGHSDDGK